MFFYVGLNYFYLMLNSSPYCRFDSKIVQKVAKTVRDETEKYCSGNACSVTNWSYM